MNINKLLQDQDIQDILLANSFKLKEQEDGTMALNSYVIPAVRKVIDLLDLRSYITSADEAEEVLSKIDIVSSFLKLINEGNYDSSKWIANEDELVYIATGDILLIEEDTLALTVKDKSSVHLRFDPWHLNELYNTSALDEDASETDAFITQIKQLDRDTLRLFETMILNKGCADEK